jgi:hypothetical protein
MAHCRWQVSSKYSSIDRRETNLMPLLLPLRFKQNVLMLVSLISEYNRLLDIPAYRMVSLVLIQSLDNCSLVGIVLLSF